MSQSKREVNGLILADASSAPITEPEPGLERQILAHSPTMMLVRHRMRKGWRGTSHSHPQEQMVYVISGSIEISADERSYRAQPGDSFIVASNSTHQATALEDSVVLDVFTPTREDYL